MLQAEESEMELAWLYWSSEKARDERIHSPEAASSQESQNCGQGGRNLNW